MDVDLLIVAGQIVNFVVLVWLLRRFLYNPIMNIIAEREQAIEARVAHAETVRAEAESQIAAYSEKRAELEKAREQYLKDAKAEADLALKQWLASAAEEGEAARKRYGEQLAAETQALERDIQEGLVRRVYSMSANVLKEISGRSVEAGLIDVFEREFVRAQGGKAGLDLKPPITVRLSFEAEDAQKERLRAVIIGTNPALGTRDIVFAHDTSLLLGIEVESAGSVSTWSARDYMTSLQEEALQHIQKLAASSGSEARRHA